MPDSRLPARVRESLGADAAQSGVRVLLVRRHHRQAPREHFSVFAAYADPSLPWAETTVLDKAEDLLDIDLVKLRAGESLGLTRHDQPLLCVCTHGRHDACCAERGRPVAAALSAARPEVTWECSHIGGDRFAGNLLVLPDGLYYGRLDAASSLAVAGAHAAGQLDLDHLRGRSGYPMPVQAAELALRRALGETRGDALRLLARRRDGDVTRARFGVGSAAYDVEVRSTPGPAEPLTCRAVLANPVPRHEVLRIQVV